MTKNYSSSVSPSLRYPTEFVGRVKGPCNTCLNTEYIINEKVQSKIKLTQFFYNDLTILLAFERLIGVFS